MSIKLKLISFDELFHRLKNQKILINETDIFSKEQKEIMDAIIMKDYSEDSLSVIPSCECGEIKGTYYVGDLCSKCGAYVTSTLDNNISFLLWIKQPKEVEKFISPIILAILLNRYKVSKPSLSLIKYIILPKIKKVNYNELMKNDQIAKLDYLLNHYGIEKGYNSFVRNFFTIIDILEENFYKQKPSPNYNFKEFLYKNSDYIFSEYLPFPNKILIAIESNELGRFIDKSLLNLINVIRRLTGIDLYTKPSHIKQNKVANSLIDLAEFYISYMENAFFKKQGMVRQHVVSTRAHFTARAVITSLTGIHEYDELHIPWSVACSLFREHILNRLYKRGYNYKEAIRFLMKHNKIYHPLLDEIFNEIINASGNGIKVFFNRNPSLHRGSIQTHRITKVKTDVNDNTFSFSYLVAPSYNADFDGDELNLMLPLTENVTKHMDNFEPHLNILTLSGINEFSSNIKYPKTVIATLNNWLYTE